ncbi:MAG: HAD hydrolase-like protein [Gemmatimonadota bacterium]
MGESGSWIDTARRVLPEIVRLSGRIDPTYDLPGVSALDDAFLARHGVSALIWDVDGTLTAHHASTVAPGARARFEALRQRADLRHAIVSNCPLPRFRELGALFPDIPVILGAVTPQGLAFRVLHEGRETRRGPGADRLGGPGVRPLRKPSAQLVEAVLRVIGMEAARDHVLMVGDQHFTDIASATLAGVRSARVPTIDRAGFPWPVRVSQRLERGLYRVRRALGFGRPAAGEP